MTLYRNVFPTPRDIPGGRVLGPDEDADLDEDAQLVIDGIAVGALLRLPDPELDPAPEIEAPAVDAAAPPVDVPDAAPAETSAEAPEPKKAAKPATTRRRTGRNATHPHQED
jgi:hypothetical protein